MTAKEDLITSTIVQRTGEIWLLLLPTCAPLGVQLWESTCVDGLDACDRGDHPRNNTSAVYAYLERELHPRCKRVGAGNISLRERLRMDVLALLLRKSTTQRSVRDCYRRARCTGTSRVRSPPWSRVFFNTFTSVMCGPVVFSVLGSSARRRLKECETGSAARRSRQPR